MTKLINFWCLKHEIKLSDRDLSPYVVKIDVKTLFFFFFSNFLGQVSVALVKKKKKKDESVGGWSGILIFRLLPAFFVPLIYVFS